MNPCDNCVTHRFCSDIDRCMDEMLLKGFGEADAHEIDELESDSQKGLKKIPGENNIFSKPLKKDELDLIKAALNN